MSEEKLEPCSCGGEAKVIKDVLGFWAVECKSCLTRLGVSETKEEIIEAWNDMRRKEKMSEEKLPHWIEENKRPKSYMWVCSECGSTAYDMPMCSAKRYVKICSLAYCPHCGAKMVGEQEVRSVEK